MKKENLQLAIQSELKFGVPKVTQSVIARSAATWQSPSSGLRLLRFARNDSFAGTLAHFRHFSSLLFITCLFFCGCIDIIGYSNESLFPQEVNSVCLEMFDNQSFRRGVEYELSDALAKRIEAETPYKIISSPDRADSIINGRIVSIDESVLSIEREVGRALEKEVQLTAVVNWKNLKTGELLIDNQSLSAQATFSEFQMQDFSYASALAANNLAQKIVELMQKKW